MKFLLGLFIAVQFWGCAPRVFTDIVSIQPALDANTDVLLIKLEESAPKGAIEIGWVKIFDSGFSKNCKWDVVVAKAKQEAIKAGGNAIKITSHFPPRSLGSSCDQIIASILKIENIEEFKNGKLTTNEIIDSTWNYAKLYVTRPGGAGILVGYDLYLGDSVICRVKHNTAQEIKINKKGYNSLWAKTEAKEEIPINIEFGKEYFLNCGMVEGIVIARPFLQLIDANQGKSIYNYLKSKKNE